jgi:hypothetical protein
VGAAVTSGGITQTLVEHWNGTQWSVVSSPNTTLPYNALSGVTATSANNIWAVGLYNNRLGRSARTLIEHWNGSQWGIVSSPNVPQTKNTLMGVTAISANDIWAVGDYATSVPSQTVHTLIEHWDGSQWSIVTSPSPGTKNMLTSITVVPGTQQLWAVGHYPTIAEFYC